mgnify:FL=1|tara:strand:- start:82483 stop:85386 length:2904 start_codon:yes stop_codon:yes gene_type:complete
MRYKFCVLLIIGLSASAQSPLKTNDSINQKKWVDSVYNSMNLNQKIGQLFVVQVFSNRNKQNKDKIISMIRNNHIGGIIYSKGGPVRQASLNNELQSYSKIPLLVGMDAEWGLSMRLDSTFAFPWNMTLGAVNDLKLLKKTGKYIGEHCKRLGVHFNFAPVVDINTNPNNPIIGSRSYGEDKYNVKNKSLAFVNGMQSTGTMACAKHFPGHGDTSRDSHKTLPTISFDKTRIEDVELFPYKNLISNGLSSIMIAHLNVPAFDNNSKQPSSLSGEIITNILKKKLNFKGLIFTDALDMKGVSNYAPSGEIDLKAFEAGNDILLMSKNVSDGIKKIRYAFESGKIKETRLAHSVKKILSAKYKLGLAQYKPIKIDGLIEDLNKVENNLLYWDILKSAQTLIKNEDLILPIKNLKNKIAYLPMGDVSGDVFYKSLQLYADVEKVDYDNLEIVLNKLKSFDKVIIGLHKNNQNPWASHNFSAKELVWLQEIAKNNKTILTVFTKPYTLNRVNSFVNINSILVAYQNSTVSQKVAAQIIFGAVKAKGKLPVSISNREFIVGHGLETPLMGRLAYGIPESVGLNSKKLARIDSISRSAIDSLIIPGAQILIARKGKVVYNKNFGFHTYEKKQKVRSNDIYDLASLTKILVSLPLIMEMFDSGVISLDDKLGNVLPSYKNSNKSSMTIKKLLSHYAGLKPWIPFYISTLDSISSKPNPKFFRSKKSSNFPIQISKNKYLRADFRDTIHEKILKSDLLQTIKYRYSDLSYYIFKDLIESHYGKTLDDLIETKFFDKIGANHTTYNPLTKFGINEIIPTEMDNYFRFEKVHGYVHDMGAAMQNGIGGHAGLFSNSNDVAKFMQMYLQGGNYGGNLFFKPKTVDRFNTCYYCSLGNRRGLGFDKPQLGTKGPTCGCISMSSFGHSGFTGTFVWADPEQEIIYVFLSNRTYPDSKINRLSKENIRSEIQRFIYDAIID